MALASAGESALSIARTPHIIAEAAAAMRSGGVSRKDDVARLDELVGPKT